jgi:hypothetical protein
VGLGGGGRGGTGGREAQLAQGQFDACLTAVQSLHVGRAHADERCLDRALHGIGRRGRRGGRLRLTRRHQRAGDLGKRHHQLALAGKLVGKECREPEQHQRQRQRDEKEHRVEKERAASLPFRRDGEKTDGVGNHEHHPGNRRAGSDALRARQGGEAAAEAAKPFEGRAGAGQGHACQRRVIGS